MVESPKAVGRQPVIAVANAVGDRQRIRQPFLDRFDLGSAGPARFASSSGLSFKPRPLYCLSAEPPKTWLALACALDFAVAFRSAMIMSGFASSGLIRTCATRSFWPGVRLSSGVLMAI